MAGDLEITAKVFGTRELVAGLDSFHRMVRLRIHDGLKTIARKYAEDVVTMGLAEVGIQSRTGRLARSMVIGGKLSDTRSVAIVYPNASDPRTKYRYPWAIGRGSPKSETMVREYLRGVPKTAKSPKARGKYGRQHVWGRRQGKALVAAGATVVQGHHRSVRLPPRPFMSGGAMTRLEAVFASKMEQVLRQAIADAQVIQKASTEDFDGMGVG